MSKEKLSRIERIKLMNSHGHGACLHLVPSLKSADYDSQGSLSITFICVLDDL